MSGTGPIAAGAVRVLQRRMSGAPQKRQLATKIRHVVKGPTSEVSVPPDPPREQRRRQQRGEAERTFAELYTIRAVLLSISQ
jgi:hypothetical protein